MQPIGIEITVREIDQVLDELEQLAVSTSISSCEFYEKLLDRLRHLVGAQAALLVQTLLDQTLSPISLAGEFDWNQLSKQLHLGESISPSIFVESANTFVFSVGSSDQGCQQNLFMLIIFEKSVDQIGQRDLANLCAAFSEIVNRRRQIDNILIRTDYLPSLNQLLANLSQSESQDEMDILFVNDLLVVLRADRVSLARTSWLNQARITAVSNQAGPIQRSDTINDLEAACNRVLRTGRAESRAFSHGDPSETSKLFDRYVAIPLQPKSAGAESAILVEWNRVDSFHTGMEVLGQVVTNLVIAWNEHQRWLRVPRSLRLFQIPTANRIKLKKLCRLLFAPILLLGAYWLLTKPIPFRLEIDGAILPTVQRNVYAMLDGTVDRLQIGDGDKVTRGQIIANMKSTALEIQSQEVAGELNAIKEKREALALSMNQLEVKQDSNSVTMNRLSAEFRQLEIQQDTLLRKMQALNAEAAKLTIHSPIDGIVVGRDLDKLLDARPVRRGDALLKIIDPLSELRLHLQIADADIGHLKAKLIGKHGATQQGSSSNHTEIDFVFVSSPNRRFKANLVWISDMARNPRGDGVYVDALATLEPAAVPQAHAGATIKAYANCGLKPLWFVFSRPFIEAIQRKIWF